MRDEEGYPTEKAIKEIKRYCLDGDKFGIDYFPELLEFLKDVWTYDDAIIIEGDEIEIHTFGWSGNETLIMELENTLFWILTWQKSERGGHYYFKNIK